VLGSERSFVSRALERYSITSKEVYFVFGPATEDSKLLLVRNKSRRELGSIV
jgi:hypothetical protein